MAIVQITPNTSTTLRYACDACRTYGVALREVQIVLTGAVGRWYMYPTYCAECESNVRADFPGLGVLAEPKPAFTEWENVAAPEDDDSGADFTLRLKALPGTDAEEAYYALERDMSERYGLREV